MKSVISASKPSAMQLDNSKIETETAEQIARKKHSDYDELRPDEQKKALTLAKAARRQRRFRAKKKKAAELQTEAPETKRQRWPASKVLGDKEILNAAKDKNVLRMFSRSLSPLLKVTNLASDGAVGELLITVRKEIEAAFQKAAKSKSDIEQAQYLHSAQYDMLRYIRKRQPATERRAVTGVNKASRGSGTYLSMLDAELDAKIRDATDFTSAMNKLRKAIVKAIKAYPSPFSSLTSQVPCYYFAWSLLLISTLQVAQGSTQPAAVLNLSGFNVTRVQADMETADTRLPHNTMDESDVVEEPMAIFLEQHFKNWGDDDKGQKTSSGRAHSQIPNADRTVRGTADKTSDSALYHRVFQDEGDLLIIPSTCLHDVLVPEQRTANGTAKPRICMVFYSLCERGNASPTAEERLFSAMNVHRYPTPFYFPVHVDKSNQFPDGFD